MTDQPTDPTGDVDITNAPTLPGLELPEYHSRKPVGMKTSVNGAGSRLTRSHEIGERVVVVAELRVKKAGHEQTDDGLLYTEVMKVDDLFEVQGKAGARLLSTVRQAYREADDQRAGKKALEADGIDLATAVDGTVMTPAELAALRGDPAGALVDEAVTPVVVVYSDGARELWPDEFDKDQARPSAGDRFEVDGDDNGPVAYVYAQKILDVDTGETIEEWTDQQEHDRLLVMEEAAEAAEAAEQDGPAAVPAYRRVEYVDGSVEEISIDGEPVFDRDVSRVVVVYSDGSEVKDAQTGPADLAEGMPPLPGEDGFGDGLEPLEPAEPEDDPGAKVIDFPAQPKQEHFEFVDTALDILRVRLASVVNPDWLRVALEAERQGRGRGLVCRKGAVDAIEARIAELVQGGEG